MQTAVKTHISSTVNGETKFWNSDVIEGNEELFNSELFQIASNLFNNYPDMFDDLDINEEEIQKMFEGMMKVKVKDIANEFLEFMEHDPNKHCELLYLSKEELAEINVGPSSKTYCHLYIDGEKVNDTIYGFDGYTFNNIRDNKALDAARFAIIRRYDIDEEKKARAKKNNDEYEPFVKEGVRVLIDTKTGKELLVPLKLYGYQTFSKNSNFVILKTEYTNKIHFMFLPTCLIILGDKRIDSYWETEKYFYIKCQKENSLVGFDLVYEVDKETAQYRLLE